LQYVFVFQETLLRDLRFHSFESIWHYRGGEIIKKIKARSVARIEVQSHSKKTYYYLKRHNPEFIGFRGLFALISPKWILSQGRKEFKNICDFRRSNLATVVPVATGEKRFRFFWVASFLITEDFSPYTSLENLLGDQPELFTGSEGETRKKNIINEIGLLARRMHQNGFNHGDFNATHILLNYEDGSDIPKIALFDIQRVDRKKSFRFRWMIKSLARLNYTLPESIFNTKDRISILQSYKGKQKLHVFDWLQWFWIKRKTARIKKHHEKMRARKEKRRNGALGET